MIFIIGASLTGKENRDGVKIKGEPKGNLGVISNWVGYVLP